MDSSLLRLPARRLLLLSSRRFGQSAEYKMNTLKSMQLMSCSPAWPTTGTADGSDNKRKAMQPASPSRQVATVEDQQPEGQPPPKSQKGGKPNWLPAFSYKQTLDAPCKFHSGAEPSNHTTRKCHWLTRIAKGDGL